MILNFKTILIACFLLSSYQIVGQTKLDSLYQNLSEAQTDDEKALAYQDLSYEYFLYIVDSVKRALEINITGEPFALKAKNKKYAIDVYNLRGRLYRELGKHDLAIESYQKAMKVARDESNNKWLNQMKDNMADILFDQGKKDEALELRLEALHAFELLKDSASIHIAKAGLGYIYTETQQLEKAKTYLLWCIKDSGRNPYGCESYANLGNVYLAQNKLDSAIIYHKLAIEIGKPFDFFVIKVQVDLADVYERMGNTEKMLAILLDIEKEYSSVSADLDFQIYKLKIAKAYSNKQEYQLARAYIESAAPLIQMDKINHKKMLGEIASNVYKALGDHEAAYVYYTYYRDAIDSLGNIRRDSIFNDIQTKYEVAKKQELIQAQNLQIRNRGVLALILVSILLVSFLLFYQKRQKSALVKKVIEEKNKRQAIEIESLKQENQLISMQSILEGQEEERKRIALDLHDNIGSMVTAIKVKVMNIQENLNALEEMNIKTELDSMITNVSTELRRISHNMTPVAFDMTGINGAIDDLLRNVESEKIEVTNDLTGLDVFESKQKSILLYRVFQEVIQNVLKHSKASHLRLESFKEANKLHISIWDDGIGLSQEIWETSSNLGIKSIQSRVNYLGGKITLENDKGSKFLIEIPIKDD